MGKLLLNSDGQGIPGFASYFNRTAFNRARGLFRHRRGSAHRRDVYLGASSLKFGYLETDASVDFRREAVGLGGRRFVAGAGYILRDLRLRPVRFESVALGYIPGPLHAEHLALAHGLEAAHELGVQGVWAITDNERLVEAFNGRAVNRAEGLREIEGRLERVRAKFAFVTLRWSRGSHRRLKLGGPTADALARAAIGLGRRK